MWEKWSAVYTWRMHCTVQFIIIFFPFCRIRRNSEKLGNVKRHLKRLDKKAVSSASLLTRSPSLEKSDTHVVARPPCPTLLFNPFVFLSPQSCQGACCQRRWSVRHHPHSKCHCMQKKKEEILKLPSTVKLSVLWPFIGGSQRHTCAVIKLSNPNLDEPHVRWLDSLGQEEALTQAKVLALRLKIVKKKKNWRKNKMAAFAFLCRTDTSKKWNASEKVIL